MSLPFWVAVILILMSAAFALMEHVRRLRQVERKLNVIMQKLGLDPNAFVEPSAEVVALSSDPTRKIEAIRLYRAQTGAGLSEANQVVSRLMAATKLDAA